ncbi:M1 family metallopeptidase [Mucilaginibacter sabulilitoris]|uniref:M1 family metallopeptidase n=1 Tax=Mucilaginibacter sabulilitoris TaxID=1173583 RepID=A0ABZ0TSI8_9SPHI|nr:M1 family metallopeptidase [Mucilaginibacter sabulilitoris]WPU96077.1 M1 family metallopeptidase [Mucilaginibacter sabulilitoris]
MIKFKQINFWLFTIAMMPLLAGAQPKPAYNELQVFDHSFFTYNGNDLRSANGAPGPKYWQNKANYLIHASLIEKDTLIKGDVSIGYTNNSPDTLNYLWLQLDQNLFRADSRGAATTPVGGDRFDVKGYHKGGYQIESVSVTYMGKNYLVKPVINDTRMQVRLPFAIKPHGDQITVKVNYNFNIPNYGADRMGKLSVKDGMIYQLAQWYPRMCVYDDVNGWDTLPYIGTGEFYCEYGNYDYYITVPAGMIVAASGDLQNPRQVLTAVQNKRLAMAAQSDSSVNIIKEAEVGLPGSRPTQSGTLTWHYKMRNTRDISWSASQAFIWDAARVNLPSGKKGMASAVYPVESKGNERYGRAAQYLKHSIEFYSKNYFEYPWHSAFVVAGVALGMEYPGIVFCSYKIKGDDLWHDVTHEMGHNWFPMIVGSNERRFMWMDEGMNTFINGYASNWFNHGEYADTSSAAVRMTRSLLKERDPLMTAPEVMVDGGQYYYKTALALNILRNVVLGADRFDYAFNMYIKRWAYKHPLPADFFRTMNDAAGEDLNWFWKEWFYTTWKLDQAVTGVKYVKNDPAAGAFITIENLGEMALPVSVKITEQNGATQQIKLPVEVWQRGAKWTFKCNSTSKLTAVIIDPDRQLPDIDRGNNVFKVSE